MEQGMLKNVSASIKRWVDCVGVGSQPQGLGALQKLKQEKLGKRADRNVERQGVNHKSLWLSYCAACRERSLEYQIVCRYRALQSLKLGRLCLLKRLFDMRSVINSCVSWKSLICRCGCTTMRANSRQILFRLALSFACFFLLDKLGWCLQSYCFLHGRALGPNRRWCQQIVSASSDSDWISSQTLCSRPKDVQRLSASCANSLRSVERDAEWTMGGGGGGGPTVWIENMAYVLPTTWQHWSPLTRMAFCCLTHLSLNEC